ncbi:FAD-dependent oxidoreductase [Streptomyces sp. NBC_01187]|uniref:FAD-dependent oxidoreductase n=1 Tax=Streptomyces sp. NBC_01187 TaxID=2903766 RepID=UPI00386AABDD|nr:FAD-dependent oxidoreductase [Streptomyces sp. NBC_01187]
MAEDVADPAVGAGSATHSGLVVVGGGPAGVAAALMAASVGTRVTLIEAAERVGGKPWHIDALENVPGGWRTGPALAGAMAQDIARLTATGRCMAVRGRAVRVTAPHGAERARVTLDDGRAYTGDAVVVATGVESLEATDVAWVDVPDGMTVPQLWRTGPRLTHALVLGADRPLGTWLRAHPEADARLEVLYPPADAYKTAELAGDPRVQLHEVREVRVVPVSGGGGAPGHEVRAHLADGTTGTFAPHQLLVNAGSRPAAPEGSLHRDAHGYCPPDAQPPGLHTAGDLRSPRHQRITTAHGSGAAAALTAHYPPPSGP